jgi:hypothetical protein
MAAETRDPELELEAEAASGINCFWADLPRARLQPDGLAVLLGAQAPRALIAHLGGMRQASSLCRVGGSSPRKQVR